MLILSGCQSARTPADAIVDYLEALAENDQAAAVANSCAAWEENALAEGASFVNVDVTLEDLECQVITETDTEATVTCTGAYRFSYDAGEDQLLDLTGRVFSVVMESGEWRMCGIQFMFD
jgi:hypothetical protein